MFCITSMTRRGYYYLVWHAAQHSGDRPGYYWAKEGADGKPGYDATRDQLLTFPTEAAAEAHAKKVFPRDFPYLIVEWK